MDQESVSEIANLLAEEDDGTEEGTEESTEELEVQLPESEENEEETDKEKDEEGKETNKEDDKALAFKEVTKKYPKLFKDFPHLRHAFFHAKEYREIFPTVEEAKEAIEHLDNYKQIEGALSRGEVADVVDVLNSFKGVGEGVVENFATNFLSSVRKMDQDLYYQVITPELVNFTRTLFDAGLRNDNDNLKNAALVASMHFFGDPKVASGEKQLNLNKEPKKKDETLERERASFKNERYSTFYNDVVQDSDKRINSLVMNGIDPKEVMTEGVKELVAERVIKEIGKTLASNSAHKNRMNSLWKKASAENFTSSWKTKIISAYIEAASEIMPKIRSSVRANVLGIRDRQPDRNGVEREDKIIPRQSGSDGKTRLNGNKKLDPKKINWSKTSDLDLFNDTVTLKS